MKRFVVTNESRNLRVEMKVDNLVGNFQIFEIVGLNDASKHNGADFKALPSDFATLKTWATNAGLRLEKDDGTTVTEIVAAGTALAVTTESLDGGNINSAYSDTLEGEGGNVINPNQDYEWSIVDGALPDGLELDSVTGVISGTPTGSPATATFTVRATDAYGATADADLSIVISAATTTTTTTTP